MKKYTGYSGYTESSKVIIWFWEVLATYTE